MSADFTDNAIGNLQDCPGLHSAVISALAEGIPSLPSYLFELNALFSTSPIDLKRVSQIIRTDPSLSAQVIRTCCALHGEYLVRRGVEDAILLLGADRIRTLVLTASVLQLFGKGINTVVAQSFWQHSLLAALAAERVAQLIGYKEPQLAYLAGLLHDLGVIPLLLAADKESEPELHSLNNWGESPHAEVKLVGADHCEIGGCLAVLWNLPPALIEVLQHHHRPEVAELDPVLMGVVAVADQFCRLCGVVLGGTPLEPTTQSASDLERGLRIHLPSLSAAQRAGIQGTLWAEYCQWYQSVEFGPSGLPHLAVGGHRRNPVIGCE